MEQKNNTGAIFKNDKKTAENQPDYRGKMMVDGKEWEISLWVRESAAGNKYMSAAIKEPYVKTDESAPVTPKKDDSDDGMPF